MECFVESDEDLARATGAKAPDDPDLFDAIADLHEVALVAFRPRTGCTW